MAIDNNTTQMSSLYLADSKIRSLTSAYQTASETPPTQTNLTATEKKEPDDAYQVEISDRGKRLAEQEFKSDIRAEELAFKQDQERAAREFRQDQAREEAAFNREQQQKQAEFQRNQAYASVDQVV